MSDRAPPRARQYSERVADALAFTAEAFRERTRKTSAVPYLAHLLQVAVHVAEHGGDEDLVIAALLHDYLEDIEGATADEVRRRFGDRVASLVLGLTESSAHPKPPWRARKDAYIARMRAATPELKLLSAADKLHNARSLRRDLLRLGDALWPRFTGSRAETLWFYRAITEALGTGWDHAILDELREAVGALHEAAEEPLGG